MMHSHFEINVALNGMHFFATAPRSIDGLFKAKEVFRELYEKFPEHEGYSVTIHYTKVSGENQTESFVEDLREWQKQIAFQSLEKRKKGKKSKATKGGKSA